MSSSFQASHVFEVPEPKPDHEPRIVSNDPRPVLAYSKAASGNVERHYIRLLAIVALLIACASAGPNILRIYSEGLALSLLSEQRWVARVWGESGAHCYAIVLTSLSGVLLIGSVGLFLLHDWARRLLLVYAAVAMLAYAAVEVSGLLLILHSYRPGDLQGVLGLVLSVGLVTEDVFLRSVFPVLVFFVLRLEAVQHLFHHPRLQKTHP